jgi:hypothetical protein
VNVPTLGHFNTYRNYDSIYIQAHPANKAFTNIGEIGNAFVKPAYYKKGASNTGVIGYGINEREKRVRLDLADPNFQGLFKYLTVWPPSAYVADANETRIRGRININTAPWYVIGQLPWISQSILAPDSNSLALAITAYRDKHNLSSIGGPDYSGVPNGRAIETGIKSLREEIGFESIGELTTVINMDPAKEKYDMRYYSLDSNDLDMMPDLSASDGAGGDFEERDVIFSRISNLVSVRSDVFTAYILVRSGVDGPQKRVIAILDRSGVFPAGSGKIRGDIKIKALNTVPEAR